MSVLRRFLGALLLGATALAVVGLATGRLASVVTDGVSMQPTYAAGDLVVVARADNYRIGDVVAYRDEGRGEVVLHRIVGGDADGFELRGDNNASTDVVTPSSDQLIGRAVLHVPTIGAWIGSPLVLALLAGVLVGAAGLIAAGGRRSPPPADRATEAAPLAVRRAVRWRWWHGALLLAHLAVLAGLVVSVAVPPTVVPPPPVPVHAGELSYGLDVPVSDVYPDGRIDTGETAFLRVVDHVDVAFRYEGDAAVSANARMRAVLEAAGGWSSVIEIAPLTPVVAGAVELRGTIDMVVLREMLGRVQDATGVTLTTVLLRVEAIVDPVTGPSSTTGSSGSVSPFRHDMAFRFDDLGLDLAEASTVTASVDGPVVARTEPVRDDPGESREVGGVPRAALRWLAVAELVLVALTVAVWPGARPAAAAERDVPGGEVDLAAGDRAGGVEPDPDLDPASHVLVTAASTAAPRSPLVVKVAAVELPEVALRVQLAARHDLDDVAVAAGAPVFERDDGWAAVVTEGAVHWWEPDRVAPVVRVLPSSRAHDRMDDRIDDRIDDRMDDRMDEPATGELRLDPFELGLVGVPIDPVDPIRHLESEVTVRRVPLFARADPGARRPPRLPIPASHDDGAAPASRRDDVLHRHSA